MRRLKRSVNRPAMLGFFQEFESEMRRYVKEPNGGGGTQHIERKPRNGKRRVGQEDD